MKQAAKKQPNAGSWKPGQSGNPNGRPRAGLAFAEALRERVDPNLAIDILLKFAADDNVSAERRLATLLPWMQAGYLRPPAQIDAHVSGDATPDRDWSKVPLDVRRAELERQRALLAQYADGSTNDRSPSQASDDATDSGNGAPALPPGDQ